MNRLGSAHTVVVGAGSAGCVTAARLAAASGGRRIALVEAGPDYGHFRSGRWPSDILDGAVDAMESHAWGFPGGVAATRGKIVGGCSAINGCGILAGLPADYDAWSEIAPGWSFEALQPYLIRAERAIRARVSVPHELDPWRRSFLAAAVELGLPELSRFDDGTTADAIGPIAMNVIGPIRWSAAFAYLDSVRKLPSLSIYPDTLVDRVVFGDRGACAVVLRRGEEEYLLEGDRIVLAAGSYATPAILVRSGVGSRQDLERLGIPVVFEGPSVGAGLRDHALVDVPLIASEALSESLSDHAMTEPPIAQVLLRYGADGSPWELQLGPWSNVRREPDGRSVASGYCGITVTITQPRSTGRVIVTSRDPVELPIVDHGFLTDEEAVDERCLCTGVELARRLAATDAILSVASLASAHASMIDPAEVRGWVRGAVEGNFHPVGTCRMGDRNDPQAVVDSSGRLRGVEGVWVVDASIFPRLPRANTHLTVLAVAERLGEMLCEL